MKNIVITGFMASGKSTVSELLSKMTGMECIDTDCLIEKESDMSINEIFSKFGEPHFRKLENELSKRLANTDGKIISTGGGFVINPENIDNLRKNGTIFLLDADFSVIEERIEKARATRPLMQNSGIEGIKQRFEARKVYYDNCDYRIEIKGEATPEEIAEKILKIYKSAD